MSDGDDATRRDDDDDTNADGTAATRREGPGARPSGDDSLARGTLIGRYVVIDVLGAGGMGVVYSAYDPELERKVAIKLLQARHGGSESGGQSWLLREAHAMARLAHPNVVAVYDVGEMSNDRVFVAMELVDGVTLRTWLRGKHGWREIVAVMRAAGTGLAAAHAAGLVHRDFKPGNVLVGNDGRVRVMDFGLARLSGDDAPRTSDLQIETKSPLSERLTNTGAVLGTPAYMAQELYGGQTADARTDQFAFGVAFYEALYHARPFKRAELVERRATAPTPPAGSKVPAWVERIVLRAIALDPDRRFASMDELLVALAKDPTSGRRRVALGGAIAVVCGGLVVGAYSLRSNPIEEPCADAGARLAGVWDAPKRSALETGFRKLNKPYADDAIGGTEKTLDAYAAGWVDMRTEACKATRVHGDQSEDVLTLRMECLDQRLVELQTLVGLFGNPDEPLVLGAATAARKLSSLADCADVPALLAPDPLPKDPAARLRVTAMQAKLAEARAVYLASRPKDALAIVTAIAPEVMRLEHRPTEATLHFMTGQALWVLQGADKGEPELMKAVLAAEAGKADETKVEAWLQLTNLANEGSHFDVAAERLQQASAALARLGTKWDLKVHVLASEALLASRQNHYDQAVAAAKQARDVADKHADTATYSYALLVEGSILNAAGKAAEALADFQKVLAYFEALGHRSIHVATTLQTMASAELSLGRSDDAIKHIQTAIEIDESIYGHDNLEVARAESALGAVQSAKGDFAAALATSQKALALVARTQGEDTDLYAMILGQLAGTLIDLGRHKEAIPYIDRALTIQTAKLGAGHVQTLTLMLTKCDALHAAGALAAAIDMCRRTLATGEKSLGHDSPLLFLFVAHTGTVFLDARKAREASAMFERALALGTTDPSQVLTVTMLDARAQWDAGNHRRAVELARTARDGFTKLGDAKRDLAKDAEDWLAHHRL